MEDISHDATPGEDFFWRCAVAREGSGCVAQALQGNFRRLRCECMGFIHGSHESEERIFNLIGGASLRSSIWMMR
jgi:hypothetical protein